MESQAQATPPSTPRAIIHSSPSKDPITPEQSKISAGKSLLITPDNKDILMGGQDSTTPTDEVSIGPQGITSKDDSSSTSELHDGGSDGSSSLESPSAAATDSLDLGPRYPKSENNDPSTPESGSVVSEKVDRSPEPLLTTPSDSVSLGPRYTPSETNDSPTSEHRSVTSGSREPHLTTPSHSVSPGPRLTRSENPDSPTSEHRSGTFKGIEGSAKPSLNGSDDNSPTSEHRSIASDKKDGSAKRHLTQSESHEDLSDPSPIPTKKPRIRIRFVTKPSPIEHAVTHPEGLTSSQTTVAADQASSQAPPPPKTILQPFRRLVYKGEMVFLRPFHPDVSSHPVWVNENEFKMAPACLYLHEVFILYAWRERDKKLGGVVPSVPDMTKNPESLHKHLDIAEKWVAKHRKIVEQWEEGKLKEKAVEGIKLHEEWLRAIATVLEKGSYSPDE